MKTRLVNIIIAVVTVIAGIVGAGIQAENHYEAIMVAKATTHANNMMAWEEYKMGRNARLVSMP